MQNYQINEKLNFLNSKERKEKFESAERRTKQSYLREISKNKTSDFSIIQFHTFSFQKDNENNINYPNKYAIERFHNKDLSNNYFLNKKRNSELLFSFGDKNTDFSYNFFSDCKFLFFFI